MTGPGGWRSKLAIVLYGLAVTSLGVQIVLWFIPAASSSDQLLEILPVLLAFLAYATVGMLILVRRPENRVGWLVGAVGFFPMLGGLAEMYVQRAPDWPLSDAARWFGAWYFFAAVWTLPLLFLIFPDGRPASRLWRWPMLIAGAGLAAMLVRFMAGPGDCVDGDCGAEDNPYQLAALRPFLSALETVGNLGLLFGVLAGAASLGWRFHRARGVERQQVKWFAGAVGLGLLLFALQTGVSLVWTLSDWLGNGLFAVMVALPAAAVAVAILRYRLYDIDRLISRTFSYAVLTTLLLGVYLTLVTTSARLLPDDSSVAVAVSTLAVAALFQPLRRRVQTVVDRRFNRARYDAERTVAAFTAQLRQEVDLDTVRADLLTVVQDTLQPASVGLWLRNPDRTAP
ncbi:MAG TPA: hypothetical protein VFD59_06110 [Nocardioidaceae bacterium]|nr:hypothetical protein [Nocardioidaceae bacterium]